ncbi:MAG: hypothetical protein KGY45_03985 [Hadesarchaea archaeon]|nr:hypothetical protein [Hadesarchaea archaeon]
MIELLRAKRRLGTDLVFTIILIVTYLILSLELTQIITELNSLFLATFAFLGLGLLILLLISDMNPRFASIIHAGVFPFFSLIFTFSKWMPNTIPNLTGIELQFSITILFYTFLMIAYFTTQLLIHQKTPMPQEIRRSQ